MSSGTKNAWRDAEDQSFSFNFQNGLPKVKQYQFSDQLARIRSFHANNQSPVTWLLYYSNTFPGANEQPDVTVYPYSILVLTTAPLELLTIAFVSPNNVPAGSGTLLISSIPATAGSQTSAYQVGQSTSQALCPIPNGCGDLWDQGTWDQAKFGQ